MQVIDFKDESIPLAKSNLIFQGENYTHIHLLKSPFFLIEKVVINTKWFFDSDQSSFQIYFCLNGSAEIIVDGAKEKMIGGQAYLVPALSNETQIVSSKSMCEVLKITLR